MTNATDELTSESLIEMLTELEEHHGSISGVATACGIAPPTLRRYHDGAMPRTSTLARIEKAHRKMVRKQEKERAKQDATPEPTGEATPMVMQGNSTTIIGLLGQMVERSADDPDKATLRSILDRMERRLDRIEDNQMAIARVLGTKLPNH